MAVGTEATGAALLCVSELVSNGLTHTNPAPSHLSLLAVRDGGSLTLSVGQPEDPGAKIRPRDADEWAENGRGLALVSGFAANWGVTTRDGRTWVFAQVTWPIEWAIAVTSFSTGAPRALTTVTAPGTAEAVADAHLRDTSSALAAYYGGPDLPLRIRVWEARDGRPLTLRPAYDSAGAHEDL